MKLTKAQRAAINNAFRILRRRGYVARQNFLCCSGCAGNELGNMLDRLLAEGKPAPRGAVFYHQQDAERLRDSGYTMIRFGRIRSWDGRDLPSAETALSTDEVGTEALAVLQAAGVPSAWDNDPNHCIEIDFR